MDFDWSVFIDLGLLSLALWLATFLRTRIGFLQHFLVPNAIVAGLLLLPFFNIFAWESGGLKNLIYHFLSLSFVAVTLRKSSEKAKGVNIFANAQSIITMYTVQALLGFGLTFLFIYTWFPDLFPGMGFALPLGFGLGPGQAFAICKNWEQFGFRGGGDVGLTFAAFGYLLAIFGGVFMINYGLRKGWLKGEGRAAVDKREVKTGVYGRGERLPVGARLTTETEAVDSLTLNAAIVFGVYFLTYMLLKGITQPMLEAGGPLKDLAVNLWGISFVFAALIALLVKKIMYLLKVEHVLDNGTQTRLANVFVDLLVVAAIAAISLVVVWQYLVPILTMVVVTGSVTLFAVFWLIPRLFGDHQFHRAIMIYGALTGTISTGLALLRVLDPHFETPAAADYMYSTGITFMLAIPLILSLNMPAHGYKEGDPSYYLYTILVLLAYAVFAAVSFALVARKEGFRRPGRLWKA